MEDRADDKVQEWLNQRLAPESLSDSEHVLFSQYRLLEERLRQRQVPLLSAALYQRVENVLATPRISSRTFLWRAVAACLILFIALRIIGGRDSTRTLREEEVSGQPASGLQNPSEKEISSQQAKEPERMEADEILQYLAGLSQEFASEWKNLYSRDVLHSVEASFFKPGSGEPENPGQEVKEHVYEVYTEFSCFLEHYTVAGSGKWDRSG